MKFTFAKMFMAISLAQVTVGFAQSTATPNAGFTLTLSKHFREGGFPKGTMSLTVRLTNISDVWIREDGCEAGGAFTKLIVLYNGEPAEEPYWIRKRREAAEVGELKGGICEGSNPGRRISLGEYWEDVLRYPATAPGTYQFTVELKLPQVGSADSPPVRSNTLTVIVPPEESATP